MTEKCEHEYDNNQLVKDLANIYMRCWKCRLVYQARKDDN
jgi:hypothetical protein